MKSNPKLKIGNFIWLAIALLVFLGLIGISFYKQSQSTKSLLQTWEVKTLITDLISAMKDAETGQRGFIMTSETDYLAPYHNAVSDYKKKIETLKVLVHQDSIQLHNVRVLDSTIAYKVNKLKENINLVENNKDSIAVERVKIKIGKSAMDEIRSIGDDIYLLEEKHSESRLENYKNWRTISIILALLSAGIVIFSIIKIYKEVYPVFNDIIETRRELQNASANLSETVNELEKSKEESIQLINEKDILIQTQKHKIENLETELKRNS